MARGSDAPTTPTLPLRLWRAAEDAAEIREAPSYRIEGHGAGWSFTGDGETAEGKVPMVRWDEDGETYRDIDGDTPTRPEIAGIRASTDRALLSAGRAIWLVRG